LGLKLQAERSHGWFGVGWLPIAAQANHLLHVHREEENWANDITAPPSVLLLYTVNNFIADLFGGKTIGLWLVVYPMSTQANHHLNVDLVKGN
jgi:hypothetical protein